MVEIRAIVSFELRDKKILIGQVLDENERLAENLVLGKLVEYVGASQAPGKAAAPIKSETRKAEIPNAKKPGPVPAKKRSGKK